MSSVADPQDQVVDRLSQDDWVRGITSASLPDEDTLSGASLWRTFPSASARAPKIVVRGRSTKSMVPAIAQLNELIALEPNWDSYGASPINKRRIVQAFELLKSIMREDSPVPSIVPTNEGSLQLEWHTAGIDLEVLLLGDNSYSVLFEDQTTGKEWEHILSSDLTLLVEAVGKLSRRAST